MGFFFFFFTTNKFNKLNSGHIPGITCNSLHLSMAHCWLLQNCPLSQTAILQYKRYKKDLEKCCVSGSGSKSGLLSNVCKNKKLAMILLQFRFSGAVQNVTPVSIQGLIILKYLFSVQLYWCIIWLVWSLLTPGGFFLYCKRKISCLQRTRQRLTVPRFKCSVIVHM